MATLFKEVNYNLMTLIQQIDLAVIGLPVGLSKGHAPTRSSNFLFKLSKKLIYSSSSISKNLTFTKRQRILIKLTQLDPTTKD